MTSLASQAQVSFTGSSAPAAPIVDDGYDGTIGSMTCDVITITGAGAVSDINVDLNMTHTWVGDLVIKLVAPDGQEMGLQSRAGFAEPADDGTGGFGESTDLDGGSTENYADSNPTDAELMGAPPLLGGDVICQDDSICDFFPNPGAIAGPTTFAAFAAGLASGSGDWMICIGDAGAGDVGQLDAWAIEVIGEGEEVEIVPTLGEWGIICLSIMFLIVGVISLNQRTESVVQSNL